MIIHRTYMGERSAFILLSIDLLQRIHKIASKIVKNIENEKRRWRKLYEAYKELQGQKKMAYLFMCRFDYFQTIFLWLNFCR